MPTARSHHQDSVDAPRALFRATTKLHRRLPFYVSSVILLIIAVVLLIIPMVAHYATPELTVTVRGYLRASVIPLDHLFVGDARGEYVASLAVCQVLLDYGCEMLFPDPANTSDMVNTLIEWSSAVPSDSLVMVKEASPYALVSCDWVSSSPRGTQVPANAQYPSKILTVAVQSVTLPDMVPVSLRVGCDAYAYPARMITVCDIEYSILLALVSDAASFESGISVAAPEISDLITHAESCTLQHTEYDLVERRCHLGQGNQSFTCFADGLFPGQRDVLLGDGLVARCSSDAIDGSVIVSVTICEALIAQSPISRLTLHSTTQFAYRAVGHSVQLVQLNDTRETVSSVTGHATTKFTRKGVTRAMTLAIVTIIFLGAALVVLIAETVFVVYSHKRTHAATTALEQGMTGPQANAIGHLVDAHARRAHRISDSEEGEADDRSVYEYEMPGDAMFDQHADADAVYGCGNYYSDENHSSSKKKKSEFSPQSNQARSGDNTPYGSCNETRWSVGGQEVLVDFVTTRADGDATDLLRHHQAPEEPNGGEHGSRIYTEASAAAEDGTDPAIDGGPPRGIPLRVDGNAAVYYNAGEPAIVRFMHHTACMLFFTLPVCVLSVVGTVMVIVTLAVQATGLVEQPRFTQNAVGATGAVDTNMYLEASTIAIYVVALVTALVATVIAWILLICRIY